MARRRKIKPEPAPKPEPNVAATTSLGSLIKAAGLAKLPAPAASGARALRTPIGRTLSAAQPARPSAPPAPKVDAPSPVAELRMLNDAYAGARPLGRRLVRSAPPVRPTAAHLTELDRAQEAAARKRLAELVSGGVHFRVKREDEFVQAWRSGGSAKLTERLSSKGFSPEITLDLHGQRAAKISDLLSGFVRLHHRRGARHLLIIVGKGLHSEDGVGVLLHAVVEALTQGLAAPLVKAFATAHASHGGSGALAVTLI
jgi:DNA-nicking Smr family endonuclease